MTSHALTEEQRAIALRYGLAPQQCLCMHFAPGEEIVRDGERMDFILILTEGSMRISCMAENGAELILGTFTPLSLVGDLELATNRSEARTNVMALGSCVCIGLPFAENAEALRNNLVFVNRMVEELAEKLLLRTDANVLSALYSVEERLCTYLAQTTCGGVFQGVLTDTAKLIGASYRQLFRIMDKLCREGVLQKMDKGYRILDPAALEARSAPGLSWSLSKDRPSG